MAIEKVALYNLLDKEHGKIMKIIFDQLGVDVLGISHTDLNESLGYFFGIEGFEKAKRPYKNTRDEEVIIFHGFSDEQMELVLDVFQGANLPYVPYKAKTTASNIEKPLHEFIDAVKEEYESRILHTH